MNDEQTAAFANALADQITEAKPPTPPPSMSNVPADRKCSLNEVLDDNLVELLRSAPLNPHVRSLVHARILLPLPEDRQTFEQIVEWIEANIEMAKTALTVTGTPIPGTNFRHEVAYSYTELGTCHYSEPRSGSKSYSLSRDTLQDLASENEDWDDFLEAVSAALCEKAEEDPPHTEFTGDTEYNDYNSTDSEDSIFEVESGFGLNLQEFIRTHMPDLVEAYGL